MLLQCCQLLPCDMQGFTVAVRCLQFVLKGLQLLLLQYHGFPQLLLQASAGCQQM